MPAMSAMGQQAVVEAPKEPPKEAGATQIAQAAVQAQAQAQAQAAPASKEKVVVTGQREQYRGDVAVEDLPQAVQVITRETLEQIGAIKLNDALDVAVGVARQNTFGGAWDAFAFRGFVGDPNVPSGYLVNGFNSGRGFGGLRDTSAVEKMEILKGPGSALFGRGEPGGTLSITTLKPQFATQGSATVSFGSHDFLRAEGDFTTALTDSTAVRINGAIEDAESFRDTVQTKRQFVSPSILTKLGSQTTLWYELEWSDQEIPFDRGVVADRNGNLGVIPNSRFLGEPGDGPMVAEVLGHQFQVQHNIDRDWVLLVGAAYRTTDFAGFGQNPELAVARQAYYVDGQTLSRQRRYTDYASTDWVVRAEVSGKFKTGDMTHHLLAGFDYNEFELDRLQIRYRPPVLAAGQSSQVQNSVNIFNPAYGFLATPTQNVFNDTEEDEAYGFYLADQIDITDAWKLRLGGRYDRFKQSIDNRLAVLQPPKQDVKEFSPQVGLSFKASDSVNIYTLYGEGFRPNTGFDVNRKPFEPEKAESFEVGLKYASEDGGITGTIAAFKMKKTNVLTADPVNAGQSIAIGEAESKGIEVDLAARLPGDAQVLLAYAYTDAYSASDVRDPDFGRVVSSGDPLINIPKNSFSLLLTKDFDLGGHALTVGGNVKYVSKRLGETGTSFYLPSYTLVRLFATYDFSKSFSVTGEVSNLTDEVYYPASYSALWVTPGAPRQYQIRASYRF
jgi:iron complex outermembrane receptor protein